MPELPEVETVARQMRRAALGQRIVAAQCHDPKLARATRALPRRFRITEVTRMGKRIVFSLSERKSSRYFAVHLRMSGRLLYSKPGAPLPKYLRASIELERGTLHFDDPRRFGTFELANDKAAFAPIGVEPLSQEFTPQKLKALIDRSSQPIKLWLMRQDRIVGIGNIYASEILFDARIKPNRRACALKQREVLKLHGSIQKILRLAIKNCGTTFSDFQDAHGATGSYQRMLKVYDREGRPCKRCGAEVYRIVQGQRSTYFCAGCQK